MKKWLCLILSMAVMFSTILPAFAEPISPEDPYSFDIEENGLHLTGAIVVEDGIPRRLTEEEYLEYSTTTIVEICDESPLLDVSSTIMPRGYNYSFSPTACTVYFDPLLKRTVSPLFEWTASVTASFSTTHTRSVQSSGGLSLTANIWKVIDAEVAARYEYSSSSSSSVSSSIEATFEPSGNCRYSAVVFTPKVALISGTVTEYLSVMGSSGAMNTYYCSFKYPTQVGYYTDGIYGIYESNSTSDFPPVS